MDSITAARAATYTLVVQVASNGGDLSVLTARSLPGDFLAALELRLEAAALDLVHAANQDGTGFSDGVRAGLRMAADMLAEAGVR
jgi:hypothetical protein